SGKGRWRVRDGVLHYDGRDLSSFRPHFVTRGLTHFAVESTMRVTTYIPCDRTGIYGIRVHDIRAGAIRYEGNYVYFSSNDFSGRCETSLLAYISGAGEKWPVHIDMRWHTYRLEASGTK